MKIAKLFEFENAHVVRNCSSKRCRTSIHGHSYKLELVLESSGLDAAQMVYDFGLLKREIKQIIDAFDHSICLWERDDAGYLASMKAHSARWVLLPFNVSAEMLAAMFFTLADALLQATCMSNGEQSVRVHAVRLNETRTGWAQAERSDCFDASGAYVLDISRMEFSEAIRQDFSNAQLLEIAKEAMRQHNAMARMQAASDCAGGDAGGSNARGGDIYGDTYKDNARANSVEKLIINPKEC